MTHKWKRTMWENTKKHFPESLLKEVTDEFKELIAIVLAKSQEYSSSPMIRKQTPQLINNVSDIDKLIVLQWNAFSLNNTKMMELCSYINKEKVDVICLQETHLNNMKKVSIPGYKCYRKDRDSGRKGGGVLIFIAEKIVHYPFPLKQHDHEIDVVGVSITLSSGDTLIIKSM